MNQMHRTILLQKAANNNFFFKWTTDFLWICQQIGMCIQIMCNLIVTNYILSGSHTTLTVFVCEHKVRKLQKSLTTYSYYTYQSSSPESVHKINPFRSYISLISLSIFRWQNLIPLWHYMYNSCMWVYYAGMKSLLVYGIAKSLYWTFNYSSYSDCNVEARTVGILCAAVWCFHMAPHYDGILS